MNANLLTRLGLRYGAKAIVVMFSVLVGLLMFSAPAHAGVGVGVAPDFPTPVMVGDNNVAVTLGITNNSSGGDGNPLTLNSIKLIPSCGAIVGVSCSTPDLGVFNVDAAATGAGACAANTFTVAVSDVVTGEVTFTPNATINLTPGQTCTINFTVDVIGSPDTDATGAPGLQTLQLANVAGTDQLQQPGSGFGSDATTVSKASPSIATQQSAGGPIGTILNDTATLSGGLNPTGSVTFKLFAPSDATCSLAPAYTDVDASAPYATSPGFASNEAGVWHWTAEYAGDASNNATSSPCTAEPVTITKAAPSIATVQSAGGPIGTVLNDTATLSGGSSPTGAVTFKLFAPSDATCSLAPAYTDVDASAPYATSPGFASNEAGVWHWTADYAGDANNVATSSGCMAEPVTITKAAPTINTVPTPASGDVGVVLNDTATLSGGSSPTGSVTFRLYAPSDATCSLAPAYTHTDPTAPYATTPGFASNAAGTWHWTAVYAGDANNSPATSTCVAEPVVISQPAGQWCSHGYWKQSQHFDSWVTYSPNQLFSSVFENAFPGKTLLQVLQQGGGGLNALGRDTVGELLNTAAGLNTGFTTSQIITNFNGVFPGSKSAYDTLHSTFVAPENCTLN